MRGLNIVIALLVVCVFIWVALWDGCVGAVSWSADSFQYLRCAENLKAVGNGGEWCGEWFATWPIGYPVIIALMSGILGGDVFIASKVVGVFSIVACLFAFWRYERKLLPILALSLLNFSCLKIFRGTLSEVLFIPILVWMLLVSKRVLPLTLIFIALFLVRYIGVFAPIWLAVGMWFAGNRDKKEWGALGIATAMAWIFDAMYLGVNWLNCSQITGMGRDSLRTDMFDALKNVLAAESNELQAMVLVAFWVIMLILFCVVVVDKKKTINSTNVENVEAKSFVYTGIAYHLTYIVIRFYGGCSELGSRFLYPGTLLIAIGLVILIGNRFLIVKEIGKYVGLRMMTLSLLTIGIGVNLLDGELWLRRTIGVRVYDVGRPYKEVRFGLLEKYKNVKSGSILQLKGLGDADLPIIFLRPDLDFKFPKGARKY